MIRPFPAPNRYGGDVPTGLAVHPEVLSRLRGAGPRSAPPRTPTGSSPPMTWTHSVVCLSVWKGNRPPGVFPTATFLARHSTPNSRRAAGPAICSSPNRTARKTKWIVFAPPGGRELQYVRRPDRMTAGNGRRRLESMAFTEVHLEDRMGTDTRPQSAWRTHCTEPPLTPNRHHGNLPA